MKIPGKKVQTANSGISASSAFPSLQYIRKALGNKADRLLKQFTAGQGRYFENNYLNSVRMTEGSVQLFEGQKTPPIILVQPEELEESISFHQLRIPAYQTERYQECHIDSFAAFLGMAQAGPKRDLHFLNHFLLVLKPNGKMILICDDHNHAAYGFALANKLGIIDNQAALFQVDEHLDNAINPKILKEIKQRKIPALGLQEIAHLCKTKLEINQHLAFACQIGLFNKNNINYVLTENMGGIVLSPKPSKTEIGGGKVLTLKDIPERIQRIRASGKKIVTSLDLDFFAFLYDPLFPEKKRKHTQNLTEDQALSIAREIVSNSNFIVIAISPDFFNVKKTVVKNLIKDLVKAA